MNNLVGEENGLVDNLLKLSVFQVRADHHLQHLEQLAVADVPVVIHVVNSGKRWSKVSNVAIKVLDKLNLAIVLDLSKFLQDYSPCCIK